MAERVVLLGPASEAAGVGTFCHALEMTALDADALRTGGIVKVRIAQFSGELANATVLELTDHYIDGHGSLEEAWAEIDGFLSHMTSVTRRPVKTPIPLWNGGRRRYAHEDVGPGAIGRARLIPEPGDLAMLVADVKLDSRRGRVLPAGMNALIDGVSDDEEFVTIKYRDEEGTHLLALAATEVEAIP